MSRSGSSATSKIDDCMTGPAPDAPSLRLLNYYFVLLLPVLLPVDELS